MDIIVYIICCWYEIYWFHLMIIMCWITFHTSIRDIISSLITTIYGVVPDRKYHVPSKLSEQSNNITFFNYIITAPVDKKISYTTGVGIPAGSFGCISFLRHVLILGTGRQLLNILPSFMVLHETGLYYVMWWLLRKKWRSNQLSGYFDFTFLVLPFLCWHYDIYLRDHFVVDFLIIVQKPIHHFYFLFVVKAVFWVSFMWTQKFIIVSIYHCLPKVWHISREGYFWVL